MERLALNLLVYKACLVAVWADEAMSTAERRHLAALIEQLAEGEEERAMFRQHSLAELTRSLVLDQVRALPDAEKAFVFERCLGVLASDGRLQAADLGFLDDLRRACGIAWLVHQARLWRLRREGVRVGSRRKAALVIGAALFGLMMLGRGRVAPSAKVSGREVRLRMVSADADAAGGGLQPELVYRFVRDSFATVEVRVDGKLRAIGSASVLGHDSAGDVYLLTNRHVVKHALPRGSALSYRARFSGEEPTEAVLDFMSEESDLALLRLARPSQPRTALVLRPRAALAVGQRVFALGSPHGLEHSFTAGIVSALRDDYLQTDATADSGSSGGPLLDAEGRLCGVVTRAHTKKDFAFALYADAVMEALAERRQKAGGTLQP